MRHYIYQITNKANDRRYIGIHSCNGEFLDSSYWGSGTAIGEAIEQLGTDAFHREVLSEWPTRKEAYEEEKRLVTWGQVNSKRYYNRCLGGSDGYKRTLQQKKRMRGKMKRRKGQWKKNGHLTGERW